MTNLEFTPLKSLTNDKLEKLGFSEKIYQLIHEYGIEFENLYYIHNEYIEPILYLDSFNQFSFTFTHFRNDWTDRIQFEHFKQTKNEKNAPLN